MPVVLSLFPPACNAYDVALAGRQLLAQGIVVGSCGYDLHGLMEGLAFDLDEEVKGIAPSTMLGAGGEMAVGPQ